MRIVLYLFLRNKNLIQCFFRTGPTLRTNYPSMKQLLILRSTRNETNTEILKMLWINSKVTGRRVFLWTRKWTRSAVLFEASYYRIDWPESACAGNKLSRPAKAKLTELFNEGFAQMLKRSVRSAATVNRSSKRPRERRCLKVPFAPERNNRDTEITLSGEPDSSLWPSEPVTNRRSGRLSLFHF